MLLLLFVLHRGLLFSSTSIQEKGDYVALFNELFTKYYPDQKWDYDLDNVAGLLKIADKSDELATKAANVAIFLSSEIYEMEVGVLYAPLM
ncbi:hypothetical protein AAVH_23259 [Aphelenchoides avenae]|nr:hypothetical protein AAVH_23259 [Aphelenchus avenae]